MRTDPGRETEKKLQRGRGSARGEKARPGNGVISRPQRADAIASHNTLCIVSGWGGCENYVIS